MGKIRDFFKEITYSTPNMMIDINSMDAQTKTRELNNIRDVAPIGKSFEYLGKKLIVKSYVYSNYVYNAECMYLNDIGEICTISFGKDYFDLIKE